jgi:hypothetical protein
MIAKQAKYLSSYDQYRLPQWIIQNRKKKKENNVQVSILNMISGSRVIRRMMPMATTT